MGFFGGLFIDEEIEMTMGVDEGMGWGLRYG